MAIAYTLTSIQNMATGSIHHGNTFERSDPFPCQSPSTPIRDSRSGLYACHGDGSGSNCDASCVTPASSGQLDGVEQSNQMSLRQDKWSSCQVECVANSDTDIEDRPQESIRHISQSLDSISRHRAKGVQHQGQHALMSSLCVWV